jgi:hypothetical protein
MQESVLLAALQAEIQRYDFSTFADQLPTVAQGGRGVIVRGCPQCLPSAKSNRMADRVHCIVALKSGRSV